MGTESKVGAIRQDGFTRFDDPVRQAVADVLVAALEGGINYWVRYGTMARCVGPWPDAAAYASDIPSCGGTIELTVDDSEGGLPEGVPPRVRITYRKMLKGVRARAKSVGQTFEAWVEDHDACEADCAVQLAVFGTLIFG